MLILIQKGTRKRWGQQIEVCVQCSKCLMKTKREQRFNQQQKYRHY